MRFLSSNSYDVVMVDGKPKELGQGGMAVVYLANDLALGTQVAIKVLKSHLLSHVQIRNKFLKEGRSLFQMSHPNVVRVYNIIDQPDCAALVMEYIEGETLRQKIARQGRFSDEEVKLHLEQLLQALQYVHDQQIIHRDIKSGNIMLDKQGQIKLLDFGIAKSINPNDTESTAMGLMSPLWASPEQLNGERLSISTDIYSSGVVLWEMASGQRPWNLTNPSLETLVEHVCRRPLPELDCSWDEQIQIATAKKPSGRYSSAQQWLEVLHGMQNLDWTIEEDIEVVPEEPELPEVPAPPELPEIEWVSIPVGTFAMGSTMYEWGRQSHEGPAHQVTLGAFEMSKYPVTFDQYDAFCDATGRPKPDDNYWGRGKRPVIHVDWNDANAFAEWMGCRLPTEAEWEYACRAGTTTRFNTGWSLNANQANFDENLRKTNPVGTYTPNAWGLYDMHGNVWEWCSDWFGMYSSSAQTNPKGPSSGLDRVLRGGGWYNNGRYCRSAHRERSLPSGRYNRVGFRLVKGAQKEADDKTVPISDKTKNPGILESDLILVVIGLIAFFTVLALVTNSFKSNQTDSIGSGIDSSSYFGFNDLEEEPLIDSEYRPPIEWVSIPSGAFSMGSPNYETNRKSDEAPQHTVSLSGFKMGKYEVTFAQYDAFCDATGRQKPSDEGWGRGNRPVINVGWNDASAFAEWMNCRLPTEAEWEYACRAGCTTPFNTASSLTSGQANFNTNVGKNHACRVLFS
jgi:sulfatase modifying factor 1